MSATANWSYTNVATIRPFLSIDMMTGETVYGPEFEIACTWAAKSQQVRANDGAEFVSKHEIFTEDRRPKYLDQISFDGSNGWEEIRSVTNWDMSFFGEEPDLKLVT
ncbi:hypothetical protein [Achromobacter xylosoxidans]|uniref:hypothetical protein n=1 Tax=Alcaligenes xylosoxydans xylosoxydans TaxID=85698 RepID=UPI00047E7BB8|nr:hypothetical protein [Achromobacter xylosoxidans]MDH0520866.1 hypothetical protein [Achromobacter xylosoxidans]MDH0544838.1 hypothetical protein [Achromobacter xylosoxidans]